MSVQNNIAGSESVVLERPAAGGVYASLFEKINLSPVSELSALDIWQDAQAMSEATADERLTAGMQVFLECLTKAGSKVEKLDKNLIDHHIAALDDQISRQLDAVMHHKDFQAMESLWRGVKSLVDKTDFRQNVKVELLDMSKDDLRQDFEDSPEIIQSGLYKHTYIDEYDTPGGEPIAALISAYEFDASALDIALLRNISKVSAAAHMPFIGSAGPKFFLKDSMEEVAAIKDIGNYFDRAEYIKWKSFRETDDSRYIGLIMPRVLGRLPYGPDSQPLLSAMLPWYGVANNRLIRDPANAALMEKLTALTNSAPNSDRRAQLAKPGYDQLKAWLMMARADKVDGAFFAQTMKTVQPTRMGMSTGLWQSLSPDLWAFYLSELPKQPQWKITPDAALVSQSRQVLLQQIGRRNAESTLYENMLKSVRRNFADVSLEDMTSGTDARRLFNTDEVVPGMFTRQAWEGGIQQAIEKAATSRRDEIDWVLSDSRKSISADLSPEALKLRLTQRYFTDFAGTWLNFLNSLRWNPANNIADVTDLLTLMSDVRQSPMIALMNTLAWQGQTGLQGEGLSDSIIKSAKDLIGSKDKPAIDQSAAGPQGPLDDTFGPLLTLMGKNKASNVMSADSSLSLQTYLTRITRVRLRLQQIASANDPQEMMQTLAQTVFQGKSVDLTDTQQYGSLVAASLGEEWSSFGRTMFVQPLTQAWETVLQPSAASLNDRWSRSVVANWHTAFDGRFPFAASKSDVSLPMLAEFIRKDSGRIDRFLSTELNGVLHKEGSQWVPDSTHSQGLSFNPAFLRAVNQLSQLSDILFTDGSQGISFELQARPAPQVVETQLTIDGQPLHYFNQMTDWQSFRWPGDTYKPGTMLTWTSTSAGARLFGDYSGTWGFIRWLDQGKRQQLDRSQWMMSFTAPDGRTLQWVLRSQLGSGPLALLALRGFSLPEQIFSVDSAATAQALASHRDGPDMEGAE